MNELYCDGGVIGRNPSLYGGTWAFRRLRDGLIVSEQSACISLLDAQVPAVTNNLTEMLALVRGLQSLPPTWIGVVYSDSLITLGRAFQGWKWKNIPPWLHQEYQQARGCLVNWKQIRWVLLQGHPTKAELAAGIGSRGYPVSEHNVWCDKACGNRAAEYMAQINPDGTGKYLGVQS